jgi:hypothetical protein
VSTGRKATTSSATGRGSPEFRYLETSDMALLINVAHIVICEVPEA